MSPGRNEFSGKNETPERQVPVDTLGSYVNMKQVLVRQVSEEV